MVRELPEVGSFFASPSAAKPVVVGQYPPGSNPNARPADTAPESPAPPAAPRARRPREQSTPTSSPTPSVSRVYASLPSEHEARVRAIAKDRGWSLLGVVAAALETYPPTAYEAQRSAHRPNPAPGSKTKMRHGDTYLPITINNAEQRAWISDTLEPYRAESVAHILGCALSHYLTTTEGKS